MSWYDGSWRLHDEPPPPCTFKVFRGPLRILHSRVEVGRSAGPCALVTYCLIWKRVAVWTEAKGWRGARPRDPLGEK